MPVLFVRCGHDSVPDVGGDSGHYCAQQRDEFSADMLSGLEYLDIAERFIENPCSHIRDTGDGQNFESHMAGGYYLGNRGHADKIGANRAQVMDFCRSLVAGAK